MSYREIKHYTRLHRIQTAICARLTKRGMSTFQALYQVVYGYAFDAWLHAPNEFTPSLAKRPKELILPRKIWFEQWNKDG